MQRRNWIWCLERREVGWPPRKDELREVWAERRAEKRAELSVVWAEGSSHLSEVWVDLWPPLGMDFKPTQNRMGTQ